MIIHTITPRSADSQVGTRTGPHADRSLSPSDDDDVYAWKHNHTATSHALSSLPIHWSAVRFVFRKRLRESVWPRSRLFGESWLLFSIERTQTDLEILLFPERWQEVCCGTTEYDNDDYNANASNSQNSWRQPFPFCSDALLHSPYRIRSCWASLPAWCSPIGTTANMTGRRTGSIITAVIMAVGACCLALIACVLTSGSAASDTSSDYHPIPHRRVRAMSGPLHFGSVWGRISTGGEFGVRRAMGDMSGTVGIAARPEMEIYKVASSGDNNQNKSGSGDGRDGLLVVIPEETAAEGDAAAINLRPRPIPIPTPGGH
jgi:hypothetical protein